MHALFPVVLVTLFATPALAGATAWQELTPGVKARLISSDVIEAGKTTIGLELDLPQGYNTYFRIPGDSGIPPAFDFTQSRGLGVPVVQWPYPIIEQMQDLRDYVYRGHLVLPMEATAERAGATLAVAVTLGICSDVCMPARASFSLPIAFGKQDVEQSLRLQMAQADLPSEWTLSQPPFGMIAATREGLILSGIDAAIDPQSIIADVGDPNILFGAPQKNPDGSTWTLRLLDKSDGLALAGHDVRLMFTTKQGPYAVTRPVGPAT